MKYAVVAVTALVLGACLSTAIDAIAYAQSGPPDPAADPSGYAGLVVDLWRSGALVPASILAAFGVAVLLRRYLGWFRTGRQAAVATAVITGLGAVAEVAARGDTPSAGMLLAAAGSALLLWVKLDSPPT